MLTAQFAAGGPLERDVAAGCVASLRRWAWEQRPTWVTWIPSRRRPGLVEAAAAHLARVGQLPLADVIIRVADRPAQQEMANSSRQAQNVIDAFAVADVAPYGPGPVLVVDDTWVSGWTMTAVAEMLRAAGSGPVLPFVLWRRL